MYENKKFLDYCKKGNFAGVFTCIMNNVDIEQRDKSYCNYTGLMYASRYGYESIVDILIEF